MTASEGEPRHDHVDVLKQMRSRSFDVRSVVLSALFAGTLFLFVDVIARAALDRSSMWRTPRRIAWLLLGGDIAPSASTTQPGLLVIALVLHAMLALVYAMFIILVTRQLRPPQAVLVGALFGLALYGLNYYLLTPLFPVFADLRGLPAVTAHLVFGATAAGAHVVLRTRSKATPSLARV